MVMNSPMNGQIEFFLRASWSLQCNRGRSSQRCFLEAGRLAPTFSHQHAASGTQVSIGIAEMSDHSLCGFAQARGFGHGGACDALQMRREHGELRVKFP